MTAQPTRLGGSLIHTWAHIYNVSTYIHYVRERVRVYVLYVWTCRVLSMLNA